MTASRGIALTGAAMAVMLAAARAVDPGSGSATTARPSGVVANCSMRSQANFPGAFTRHRNLVVGPLALVGAGGTATFASMGKGTYGGNKFPLLVRAGHRVTVELSARTHRHTGLAYGPLSQGEVRLSDTHRVVTFIACRRGIRSGSSADGKPVTFWSGSVLASSPRCVPLRVWVDNEPAPRHAVLHLGVRNCP